MAFLMAVLGAVVLRLTHGQILAGELVVGPRGAYTHVFAKDPRFWSEAGTEMGFGLVMLLVGLAYGITGRRYLPEIDPKVTSSYLAFSLLAVAATFAIGWVLKSILPLFYG